MPAQSTERPPIASWASLMPFMDDDETALYVPPGSPLVSTYGHPSMTATYTTSA